MESNKMMKCKKCDCELVMAKVNFSYLERQFSHTVPRCPKCGQVYISEELASGKMSQLEKALEEK